MSKTLTTKARSEVRTSAPSPKPAGDAPEIPGNLPLSDLRPSPTNPRRTFPEEGLHQLAASFAEHGILQPLLVRPMGEKGRWDGKAWCDVDYFEVVCGERRFRAAKLNGTTMLPVVVRFLSDAEALEIQLIENDQREDVKPSEQAAAYARLVAAGKTIEDVVQVTGKTVSFVRSVLALAKLPESALAAVDAGTLPRRTAELVARIPNEKARKECAAWVLVGERYGYEPGGKLPKVQPGEEPMTYRETLEFIARDFQIELKQATFSRKALDLVAGVGSCDECPKRAGNDPDAKAAGTRADVCLDPVCFRAKTEGHAKQVAGVAKSLGSTVLPAKEADKLFDDWGSRDLKYDSGYVDLDSKCQADGARGRTYKTLLKELPPEKTIVAFDQAGQPRHLVKVEVAKKVLKDEHKIGMRSSDSNGDESWRKQQAAQRKKAEAGNVAAERACGIVVAKIDANCAGNFIPNVSYLRPLVLALIDGLWADAWRHVARRRDLGKGDPRSLVTAEAKKLATPSELLTLAAEGLAAKMATGWGSMWASGKMGADGTAFWKAFGVDRAKLVKDAQAEQKKPKAKAVKAPPAKAAKTSKNKLGVNNDVPGQAEKSAAAKAEKPSKNGVQHKPGCTFEADLAAGFPHGLRGVAKPLRDIPGMPPAIAMVAEEAGCGTDIALSERVNKQRGKLNHEEKIRKTLRDFPGTLHANADAGTEAFLNYLEPGRLKKQAKAAKNGKPPALPVTKPVGSLSLRDVPNFPAAAADTLEQSRVVTLADLEPHVEAQKGKLSPMFEALRKLGLSNSPHLFAAGDALVEHLMPSPAGASA